MVFPLVLLALFVTAGALVLAGYNTVLQSTDGKLADTPTDPSQPGWVALTEPTPTMLLLQVDDKKRLNSVTVLSLTAADTGGVILIPKSTVLQIPGIGDIPLDKAYETGGAVAVQRGVEAILQAGLGETQVVDAAQWSDLVKPVAPVALQSPDVVGDGTGAVFFPKGALSLRPDQVGPYLSTVTPGSDDLNRLLRQQNFWKAWLAKVQAGKANPGVLPGETDSGLGRYVRRLADAQVTIQPLPVSAAPTFIGTVYVPVADDVRQLVSQIIPFPVSSIPGARVRTRILDGTGRLDHGISAAPLLVRGGAQIDAVGNAARFDYTTTELVYSDENVRPQVERLREALGIGALRKTDSTAQAVDVTVVLGSDFAASPIASRGTGVVVTSTALPSADTAGTKAGIGAVGSSPAGRSGG